MEYDARNTVRDIYGGPLVHMIDPFGNQRRQGGREGGEVGQLQHVVKLEAEQVSHLDGLAVCGQRVFWDP
jgi:hypothetical protein